MRNGYLLVWAILLAGCGGRNTTASSQKTKAEQLDAIVPSWCESTCARIAACPSGVVPYDDCPAECEREMSVYTEGPDGCATVGELFKQCIDRMTCEDIAHNGSCVPSDYDKRLCPDIEDSVPVPGATGDGPSTPSSGGTGSGPTTSSGTAGTTANTVLRCASAYGAAGASQPEPASSAVICEEGRGACDDGHEYSWMCVRGSAGQLGCTCFVDAQVTGGFDPGSSVCPSQATVGAGCHWTFAP